MCESHESSCSVIYYMNSRYLVDTTFVNMIKKNVWLGQFHTQSFIFGILVHASFVFSGATRVQQLLANLKMQSRIWDSF